MRIRRAIPYARPVRVFVAGATGVIGLRLVPLLVADGHVVAGMTRSPDKVEALRSVRAEPVICDALDAAALRRAVVAFRPDVVVHQLTNLPDDASRIPEFGAANARVRREGTANLIAATKAAGALRLLAQSVAWELPGDAGDAIVELEAAILGAGGVVLRYGQLYGPGTYHEFAPAHPRIHVDEAARRTVEVLDAPTGVAEIVERSTFR
jgi:uncharacterized protein YbjT (DUF2867 family)